MAKRERGRGPRKTRDAQRKAELRFEEYCRQRERKLQEKQQQEKSAGRRRGDAQP